MSNLLLIRLILNQAHIEVYKEIFPYEDLSNMFEVESNIMYSVYVFQMVSSSEIQHTGRPER